MLAITLVARCVAVYKSKLSHWVFVSKHFPICNPCKQLIRAQPTPSSYSGSHSPVSSPNFLPRSLRYSLYLLQVCSYYIFYFWNFQASSINQGTSTEPDFSFCSNVLKLPVEALQISDDVTAQVRILTWRSFVFDFTRVVPFIRRTSRPWRCGRMFMWRSLVWRRWKLERNRTIVVASPAKRCSTQHETKT